MHTLRILKTATAAALLASAFAAEAAAVPNGCQRVSGEEGGDEQYFGSDAQGIPIYCAAGSAQNGTPMPRGSDASGAVPVSPYGSPAQGYNDAASQAGGGYGQGSSAYPQVDYGQGAAGYPPAQSGGWQGSGQQGAGGYGGGSAGGAYGSGAGGYGGSTGGYGGASAGGIQGGSFKGGAYSQNNGASGAGSNPYATGNAFVKRPKKCKTNCPPAGAPVDQTGYGQGGGYGDQTGYGPGAGYSDPAYGSDAAGSSGGPSSSQGNEPATGAGAWAGASANDHNHVPVDTPPFGDGTSNAGLDEPAPTPPVAQSLGGPLDGSGIQPAKIDPNQLKKPPVATQPFQPGDQPMPKLPGGLLEPLEEPKQPALVQELPKQPPGSTQPATLIDIRPGVAVGGSAAIEAAKKKKKPPTVVQWPKP
ncbi:MAG: hypothetical protein V4709_12740 [Pseudomonadota bacterium]